MPDREPMRALRSLAVDRSGPPPPGDVHLFHFPDFVRRRLPSGVLAYAARLGGAPLLSLELLAPAGAQYDPAGRSGLATLTASLLDEGAAGRNAMQIAGSIERLGGQLGTSADWDVGYAGILVLSRHVEAALRLLAEVAASPSFPPAEVERLRRLRLAELMRRRHQPSVIADEELAAAIYQGTVYAGLPYGTEASISALGRDEILGFYRRRYRLPELMLIAVGDREPEELLAAAEAALAAAAGAPEAAAAFAPGSADAGASPGPVASASAGAADERPRIEPPPLPGLRIHVVDRPGAAQTELRLGHAGVPFAHPDFTVLSFLNTVLGGKFTSRINLNLRERHGYTYGATSRFSGRLGPGPFVVSAAVATEASGNAAREVLSELRRIQDEPVETAEMDETRSYMLGVFPYTVQGLGDVARRLADLAVYGLPDDHYDRYLRTVASLSRADVQAAARRHLHPDRLAIVAVGPAEVLRPQFEPLGEVIVSSAAEPA
jgi:zinc protease